MQRRFFPKKEVQSIRQIRNRAARDQPSIHQDKIAKEAKDNKVGHKFLCICEKEKSYLEHRPTSKANIIKSNNIITAKSIDFGHECDLEVEIQSAISHHVQKVYAKFV